jgi:SM-20-related protein
LSTVRKTSNEIADELGQTGLSICENFLSPANTIGSREDLALLQASGQFRRAGVGHGAGFEIRDEVRRDEIHWLDRGDATAAQDILWTELDSLKTAFNRNLFLGLNQFEGHYASYEKGGFYRRHHDSFGDSSTEGESRIVSLILYLNENWQPSDGGELRVYSKTSHTDVAPIGGTLVCFMSRESEHEVLTSTAARLSFAGWFGRSGL